MAAAASDRDVGPETMEVWKDVDLYEQGLKDFESLTPLQRDWFVIKDLDIYDEMEEGFEDYILSGGHTAQVRWLGDALRSIGDVVSVEIISRLQGMGEDLRLDMGPLCRAYSERRHQRWSLLERHLEQRGVHLDESA